MKLKLDNTGVYLNGIRIDCTRVDINNISPTGGIEAILHVPVDPIDVRYESRSYAPLRNEQGQR